MVFFQKHGLSNPATFIHYDVTDFQFPPHFHPAYELLFVDSGAVDVFLDNQYYRLTSGQAIFIHSNQLHHMQTVGTTKMTVLLFSQQLISDFDQQYKGEIAEYPVINFPLDIDLAECKTVYHKKAFLYQFISRFISMTDFIPHNRSTNTTALYDVLLYVEAHYNGHCSLKEAANILQYDYTYLSLLFKQMTNMSFTDYVNQYRIGFALDQLKNSELTISEIARQSGYDTLRTFNRNFLKWVNMTATDYRKKETG